MIQLCLQNYAVFNQELESHFMELASRSQRYWSHVTLQFAKYGYNISASDLRIWQSIIWMAIWAAHFKNDMSHIPGRNARPSGLDLFPFVGFLIELRSRQWACHWENIATWPQVAGKRWRCLQNHPGKQFLTSLEIVLSMRQPQKGLIQASEWLFFVYSARQNTQMSHGLIYVSEFSVAQWIGPAMNIINFKDTANV